MDRKIAGLLGAAAAVTTLASAQAAPTSPPQVPEATSYLDLLDPIANPIPQLKADNARLAEPEGSQGTRLAQVTVQIGHHHHHHHHRRHHHHHHHHHHHY